jgi:hypothetical protein
MRSKGMGQEWVDSSLLLALEGGRRSNAQKGSRPDKLRRRASAKPTAVTYSLENA